MDAQTTNPHINLVQRRKRPTPYHEAVARLALKYSVPGSSVLDVGTGAGNIPALIGPSRTIDVADAYQSCLDSAREGAAVRDAFLIDEEDFDIAEQVGSRRYDVVTMSHVLEHLKRAPEAVDELLSLLNPGGYLILAVPNAHTPTRIANSVARRHACNEGHYHIWDAATWRNFLETRKRLNVVEYAADSVRLLPARLRVRVLGKALARVFPGLATSLIAVVRKA